MKREPMSALGQKQTFLGRAGISQRLVQKKPGQVRKFRYEYLNQDIFYSLKESMIVIERWRRHYNTVRAHSFVGYWPPAP